MTGKGVRWGRDSLGRSEPALMAASTTVLPPLTCTARGRRHLRQLLFLLRGWPSVAVVSSRPVPGGESAGCVCLQCLFCRLLFACCHFACHAHCPSHHLPPFSLLCALPRSFCFPLFIAMCARIGFRASSLSSNQHVCKLQDCPVGSCNTGLQWRPVRRVHF